MPIPHTLRRFGFLSLAAPLLVAPVEPLLGQSGQDVARAYREANEPQLLADFAELLTYPNRASDLDDTPPAGSAPTR